jgi:hypothetical protein
MQELVSNFLPVIPEVVVQYRISIVLFSPVISAFYSKLLCSIHILCDFSEVSDSND